MAGSLPSLPPSINHPKPSPPNPHLPTQNPHQLLLLLNYLQTITHGHPPRKKTFISAIKACSATPTFTTGRTIHAHIIKIGLGADRFVATSIVSFYSSSGLLSSAHQLFDRIPQKDQSLQTAMLTAYAENSDIASARVLFNDMLNRDVVAWNAMMSAYVRCGLPEDALELFRAMQISEVRPNEVTVICALSACSQIGCSGLGEWIHLYIIRNLVGSQNPKLSNALVHMYAKCGRLDAAFGLFVEQRDRNLESWNTMLTSFAIHGYGMCALSVFSQMIKTGVRPDRISFLGILMACSHTGMVDNARFCFDCMSKVYCVDPRAEHYGCMVDVLARGGLLEEARTLIGSMPYEPAACVWGALLGGCFIHGNYELGFEVARHLLKLEPTDENRYSALLNLYTGAGRVEDAMELRKVMAEMGIKQTLGRSVIELDGVVHEFLAGDRSHCRSKEIYSIIQDISLNLGAG